MPANPLNTDDFGGELYNLGMSEGARPLLDQVKAFIADEVEPITAEFFRLGEGRADRWSFVPGQLELLDGVKAKAKANGLWNFFLPDAETGQGLSNLDYAYIAVELGKNPLASECLNCAAPDTGNMEVLERVGTPEQKKQWLEPLLNGEIRSVLRDDRARPGLLRRPQHRHVRRARRRRVGDQRREVLHLRCRRSALQDHDLHGADEPGRRRPPAAVADPRADGHAGRRGPRSDARVRPRRRPARPHAHPAHRRAGAEGEHPARRGPRLRDLPAPPRPGPHPPLHACDRGRRAGAAAHGRAGPEPGGLRQAAHLPRQEHRARRRGRGSRSRPCG